MLFFIIFGTRGMTSSVDRGQFFCPICQTNSYYILKSVRRWFTLYFIPCIPLNRVGQYVECQNCRNELNDSVLQIQPQIREEFNQSQRVYNAERID